MADSTLRDEISQIVGQAETDHVIDHNLIEQLRVDVQLALHRAAYQQQHCPLRDVACSLSLEDRVTGIIGTGEFKEAIENNSYPPITLLDTGSGDRIRLDLRTQAREKTTVFPNGDVPPLSFDAKGHLINPNRDQIPIKLPIKLINPLPVDPDLNKFSPLTRPLTDKPT